MIRKISTRRRHGLGVALGFALAACGGAGDDSQPIWVEDVGFMTPESVLHDTDADIYLVSNINGSPFEEDGNGFISRISPAGEVLDLKWIDGTTADVVLNAPKGMAVIDDKLYVSDISVVRIFDRESGAPMGEVPIDGSTFLNDLAAGDEGELYVTDSGFEDGFAASGTDAVYRITSAGDVERLAWGDELARPNGVIALGGEIWVVAFGANAMYRVEDGGIAARVDLPMGGLDGIEALSDGSVLVSSWDGQAIYRGPVTGPFETVVSDIEAPADLGYDRQRNRVLIPLFQSDRVLFHPLN